MTWVAIVVGIVIVGAVAVSVARRGSRTDQPADDDPRAHVRRVRRPYDWQRDE